MTILVLGRSGQVARALAARAASASQGQLCFAGRPELDLSNEGAAAALIRAERPELVINAAAYTAVDRAEEEPASALRINAGAAVEAASAAYQVGAGFIQLSTDYVFDGSGVEPWREDDCCRPLNSYGRSKLAGEELVRAAHPGAIVLRTSWLYGPTRPNFVATMLRLATRQPEVRVVADQVGAPTHVEDLADVVLTLARRPDARGRTIHVAGSEWLSWAQFAAAIFEASRRLGGPSARVLPISSEDFAAPAERPRNSRLCCNLLRDRFGLRLPGWSERIRPTVAQLLKDS